MNTKYRHRWREELTAQEGRLWRILWLAAGETVRYEDIERRLGWPHAQVSRPYVRKLAMALRWFGYDVLTQRGVGLRMVTR